MRLVKIAWVLACGLFLIISIIFGRVGNFTGSFLFLVLSCLCGFGYFIERYDEVIIK